MVDMTKAYYENIMPWEIEAFAAYSIVYDDENATVELDGETFQHCNSFQFKEFFYKNYLDTIIYLLFKIKI